MKLSVDIDIAGPKAPIWDAITDIEHCTNIIGAIINIHILEKPDQGILGLKWQETRKMFGKEAVETMWITEAVEHDYYRTRAESHGSVYLTKLSLNEIGDNTRLTMAFSAEAQSLGVKIISKIMGFMIKGAMMKALQQDLQDIKNYIEDISS